MKLIVKSKNYITETILTIKCSDIETCLYTVEENRMLLNMHSGRQHQIYKHDKIFIKNNDQTTEINIEQIPDYI